MGGCGHEVLIGMTTGMWMEVVTGVVCTRVMHMFVQMFSLLVNCTVQLVPIAPLSLPLQHFQIVPRDNTAGHLHAGARNGQCQQDTKDSAW